MRNKGWLFTGMLLVVLAGVASVASAATYPHERNGWSIGVGIGGGSAGLNIDNAGSTDRTSGGIGNLRVGYSVNPQLALAVMSNAWSKSENGATVTFNATTVGAMFYPADGWVARAGVGLGRTTASFSSGNTTLSSTETGFGLNGGLGYQFRLARTFALSPELDAGYATFSGGSSNWFGGGIGFDWYFLSK